jgi:hypothetical protein
LFTTEPVSLNFLNGFPNTLSVTEFFTAWLLLNSSAVGRAFTLRKIIWAMPQHNIYHWL